MPNDGKSGESSAKDSEPGAIQWEWEWLVSDEMSKEKEEEEVTLPERMLRS